MIISTKNLLLKTFSKSLVNQDYYNWFNDHDVKKYIKFKPKNIHDLKKSVDKIIKEKNSYFFAIFYKSKHIGNVRIHNINKNTNEAWLGILIGNKLFRKRGYSKEVITFIQSWLLKRQIYFLKLGVEKSNVAALKLYQKCNFQIHQKTQQHYIMINKIFLSKFILGAAQFNSKYGVTNFNRKNMKRSETNKILNYLSTKSSINELDSATNYKIDQKNLDLLKKKIYLNTKILTTEKISYSKLKNFFDQGNTNQKITINTVFIHDGDNVLTRKGIELLNKLKKLKKNKKIMKVGLSIHKYENLLSIINKVSFDVIQLPYNFVDRRAEVYFSKLKDKNIEIQVRSIFLQGSLLTKVSTNKKLSVIFEKFNQLSQNKHINRLRYILSFILRSRYIDKVIIGIRDLKELKQINNINFFYNSVNALNKLKSSDQKIINPLEWKELVLDEKKSIKSI